VGFSGDREPRLASGSARVAELRALQVGAGYRVPFAPRDPARGPHLCRRAWPGRRSPGLPLRPDMPEWADLTPELRRAPLASPPNPLDAGCATQGLALWPAQGRFCGRNPGNRAMTCGFEQEISKISRKGTERLCALPPHGAKRSRLPPTRPEDSRGDACSRRGEGREGDEIPQKKTAR